MTNRIKQLFWHFAAKNFNDKLYLKIKYRRIMKSSLCLIEPKTFTQKLNWLKIYDHNPVYTTMVDKYLAKAHVANIIGQEHIIPTIAVWDSVEQIDFDQLPNRFVLKCNHDSDTGVVICNDKASLNKIATLEKLGKAMKEDYFSWTREWPYKNVERKIIAEQFIEDTTTGELRDYKFFCFNGKVRFFKIDFNRHLSHKANYYLPDGSLLPFGEIACPPDPDKQLEIPVNLQEMIEIAEKLSAGIPFLRVDLYNINGIIYFGELTFYPASGFGPFEPDEWDSKIGDMLTLPDKQKCKETI